MTNSSQHWDDIYQLKDDCQLGWFEADAYQTIKFLNQCNISEKSTVFIPGAGTSLLVDELAKLNCHLILNDLSKQALTTLKERVGEENKTYSVSNIALKFTQKYSIDVWIDRAVLHFLLTENEINGYFNNLKNSVKKNGYVLLAEFSTQGAKKCAGLPLHQYSIEEMQSRLGDEFSLLSQEAYTFINPFGAPRPYVYGLFQRKSSS
ncbi:methyltransferase domain-containing protein [Thalassotalea sp. M1531]|uniref:Methyltransferase domain-containing protein n=1 Tax=Thalassotalea algicola TaxID=2716224 RepID=A0A7Y0Q5G1_9GAMM|nr:methyltransferase [Thalassotalea algicola]NMP30066.1 methyltransferase domain-containing protein [Thalassotalea algicola]